MMYSRRAFLIGLVLLSQMGFISRGKGEILRAKGRKFVKQGWLLQEGDL